MNCKWLPAGLNPSLYCKQPRPRVTPHVQGAGCAGGTCAQGGMWAAPQAAAGPDPKTTPQISPCDANANPDVPAAPGLGNPP